MRRSLALAILLALGCVPRTPIPELDRQRAAADLAGQRRWLRVAVNVGPFFGDATKALLTDQPASEVDLLESPGGSRIAPPPPERVLPPGTPVRIREVDFPTGLVIASRVVLTPRYHPWVLLELPDEPRTAVLVLSQSVDSYDDVLAEVGRVLATDDPSPLFQSLPPAQREAVLRKGLAEGMSGQAVAMAWGFPYKKIVDRPAGTEEWIWAEGRRRAFLQDGRLTRWEQR